MNSYSIYDELRRNNQLMLSDLNALKNWFAGRMKFSLNDADFALFLHRNYYDLEATKTNLENYFILRSMMPEFFSSRDPLTSSELKDIFENVSVVVLPKHTPEGYTVVLFQLLDYDPNRYDFNQAVKYLNMVLDVHVFEHGTTKGYVYVCDIKGSTTEHIDRLPFHGLAKFFQYLKTGAHFRWIGMHYFNSDSNGDVINNYVKSKIVDVKFNKNIFLHEKIEDMDKVIPTELFPVEMGGSECHLHKLHQAQVKKIKDYTSWFNLESRLRLNRADMEDENNINQINKLGNSGSSVN